MSNEMVSELYNEYQLAIKNVVDDNDYYGHLMNVINSGANQFSLFNRYFEKKIDIRWVDAIEKCIIPLDTIIRNPRKFIVQEEEIVPIERARKITAESVRHLAQHTSMIARVEGDKVTPSQILNVFREESFEIYENRFIYTLLRNLQHFIDQRYEVLFGLANDETMSSLKMESDIDNGREKIKYKLEISTQSVEDRRAGGDINDTKDATAFQRIERIKRIVNEFAHSSFMRDLQGCTPVRPPIMRTNVISKDVNFRACLDLWQFISSYSEVGYEIITKETDEMVSDEYRDDLYRIFATNYMLLKNNSVEEENIQGKIKKRKLKPKMLKRLAEELVLDYDMEEVEIRKIFVDELKRVSKRKIAGEEKIRGAITRALDAENARKAEIEAKIKAEIQRQKDIEKRRREREAARIAREKALEKERIAREKARAKAKKEKEIAMAKEAARKEKERLRIAKEKAIASEKAAKEKEKQRILKEKERQAKLLAAEEARKEKAKLIAEQRKAKLLAIEQEKKEKEKLKKQLERQRERERIAKQKAEQLAKEKAALAKQKEKERQEKLKEQQAIKEKAAIEKQKEKELLAKERLKEKEKAAKEKTLQQQKEKAEAAKIKEKEHQAKLKEQQAERERIAKAKQKEKEQLAKEKQKEKERLAKEKALQLQKEKAEAAKQKEKERQQRVKEQQAAKAKEAREKLKEKERIAKQKAQEKARAQKAKAAAPKAEKKQAPTEDSKD